MGMTRTGRGPLFVACVSAALISAAAAAQDDVLFVTGDMVGIGTRDGAAPDVYVYPSNGTGNLPQLSQIQLGPGGTRDYSYGPAGHLELVQSGANPIDFVTDDEGRLAGLDRFGGTDVVALAYDGRRFLRRAEQTTGALARTEPVYDSQGRVRTLRRYASGGAAEEPVHYFYFGGRPVAQLAIDGGGLETWAFLTADHLGTPVLATDGAGGLVWQGGFEPFGRDWRAGSGEGASENGIFLRLPGQWDDGTWEDAASAAGLFYNVHRWYQPDIGRYTRPDPLVRLEGPYVFAYAAGNPVRFTDPTGLAVWVCSRKTVWGVGNHSYFWDDTGGLSPDQRFCGRGGEPNEMGPKGSPDLPPGVGDDCNMVPGSDGREPDLMKCCRDASKHGGFWFPGLNDCATVLDDCIKKYDLTNPGPPGGRFGPPCDKCTEPEPPDETEGSPPEGT